MAAVSNHTHIHNSSCCKPKTQGITQAQLFRVIEKVSAIALGAFAALTSLELFLSFFTVGAAIGVYQHFFTEVADRTADCGAGSCGQALEQLTGAKLPYAVSLAATCATMWCHIDHHPTVFVPVVGVSLGAWAGQTAGDIYSKGLPSYS